MVPARAASLRKDWVPGGFGASSAIWATPEARSRANRVPWIIPGIKEPSPRAPVGAQQGGGGGFLADTGESGEVIHSDLSKAQARWAKGPTRVPFHWALPCRKWWELWVQGFSQIRLAKRLGRELLGHFSQPLARLDLGKSPHPPAFTTPGLTSWELRASPGTLGAPQRRHSQPSECPSQDCLSFPPFWARPDSSGSADTCGAKCNLKMRFLLKLMIPVPCTWT